MVPGLLLMMNYFKFSNILTDVTTSRLAVINKNLESSLSRATNLGLALDELQFADTLLKRAKVSDAAIQEIEVFDNNGAILFATGRQVQGGKVDPSVLRQLAPIRKPANVEWSAHTEEQFVAGVTLFNSFDRRLAESFFATTGKATYQLSKLCLKTFSRSPVGYWLLQR
jgi:hypothetical protein